VKRQARPLLDQVLLPFVYAKSEIESEAVLERLICDFAQPLIRDIVSFKLRAFAPRVTSRDGYTLTHARDAREAQDLTLHFTDGTVDATVGGAAPALKVEPRKRKPYIPPQPGLFDPAED